MFSAIFDNDTYPNTEWVLDGYPTYDDAAAEEDQLDKYIADTFEGVFGESEIEQDAYYAELADFEEGITFRVEES